MTHSADAMSKSTFLASQGTLLIVLGPLKQMRADLNRANVFALIQEMALAYCFPFFNATSSARRLWYLKHSWPILPVVGVNVPCSMLRTLLSIDASSHSRAFCRSSVALSPCTIRCWRDRP